MKDTKVYKLDAVGHNTLQIIPNGNGYILMMNTSNGGHASVVVDKSRLLWLADFIYETIGKKMITIPRWEYYLLYFIAFMQCLNFLDRILTQ